MATVCIYDDPLADLAPLNDLRPSFDIRTGAMTTLERADLHLDRTVAVRVAADLIPLSESVKHRPVNPPVDESVICISSRWLNPKRALDLKLGEVMQRDGDVLAAHFSPGEALRLMREGALPAAYEIREVEHARVIQKPWDVIRHLTEQLQDDLPLLTKGHDDSSDGAVILRGHPVRIAERARIYPTAVLDAERGPIFIDEDAVIRPHACVIGPAYVGKHSTVHDGAVLRAGSSIGPHCRVAGEIGATVFQGYANKGHYGYLGDTFVGEWVNIGAGTTTSNLKNTYGRVRATNRDDQPLQETGLTFLGSILGDHVKTAIGTRLMTGSVVLTGAQVACECPPPRFLSRFAWLKQNQATRYDIEKFIEVSERVMQRRGIELSDAYAAKLRALAERPGS